MGPGAESEFAIMIRPNGVVDEGPAVLIGATSEAKLKVAPRSLNPHYQSIGNII
jgi:hypothetical protein